jgi:hypothetical protein
MVNRVALLPEVARSCAYETNGFNNNWAEQDPAD